MPAPVELSARAKLRIPPDKVWSFLADTDRLNRAIKLPAVSFTPLPDPGRKKGHYRAEATFLCSKLKYEEFPFEWVEERYYRVLRKFDAGAILELSGGIRFHPVSEGTEIEVFATITPRNWIGRIAAKTENKLRSMYY